MISFYPGYSEATVVLVVSWLITMFLVRSRA